MSSTIKKESLKLLHHRKKKHYYYHEPSDNDTFKVNSDFPWLADRRHRCCVHAPFAARVYLPYLHMLLFTPEGEMSRLHLNTEITAMPDSDKPRPLPPAQAGISLEFLQKSFNFYSSLGDFWWFSVRAQRRCAVSSSHVAFYHKKSLIKFVEC